MDIDPVASVILQTSGALNKYEVIGNYSFSDTESREAYVIFITDYKPSPISSECQAFHIF